MTDQAKEWLSSTLFPWPAQPPTNKIDTHHHWVPEEYAAAVKAAGGDPSGWPTPSWSLQSTENLMQHVGAASAILSITAPGACIVKGPAGHKLARDLNRQAAAIRDKQPQKFGFFASLASVLDTRATLEEISYAFDVLQADGVCLFTRYGDDNHYLGHKDIEPIWEELNRRNAVVFVHPTHPVDTNTVNARLPQPSIDYPHETTRTALDMLMAGTRHRYPNTKVILSHAGGTLPWIIGRIATPLSKTGPLAGKLTIGSSHEQFMKDFRSFHYDVALSTSPAALQCLFEQVPSNHILYGSDFPYAPLPAYPAFLETLENYNLDKEQRDQLNFKNALQLFPRLQQGH